MASLIQRSLHSIARRARSSQRLRRLLLGDATPVENVLAPAPGAYLGGDRALEDSWVIAHLPASSCRILDVGCSGSPLPAICARLGHEVVGVDLNPMSYNVPGFAFRQGDFNRMEWGGERFDVIVFCSSVEHFGLEDRFGATATPDADLEAMARAAALVVPGGKVLLTVPVGVDAVVSPWHRIYGPERLPRLLQGHTVVEEEFWWKPDLKVWGPATRAQALSFPGHQAIYALGLFVLARA